MAHLSILDLDIILSALRSQGKHIERMQYLCPSQYDFYKKEYEKVERIYKLFNDTKDRVFRSENMSARIGVKIN